MAQKGGAYENPQLLFGPDNVALMAQTMSRYRESMANSREMLEYALKKRSDKIRQGRKFKSDNMSGYESAYTEAKGALAKFQANSRDKGENLAMTNQINNALRVVGENLNNRLTEIGQNGSQADISRATSDAISEVNALKNQLTTFNEAYTEWKEYKDLAPGEPNSLLATSNPQLQLLFQRLDDGQDNIILQQDPTNKNWLFIPLEMEEDRENKEAPLNKRWDDLANQLSDDWQNNPTERDKIILREQTEINEKILDLRAVDKYDTYRSKEGDVTSSYNTEDPKGGYVYDQTIGIVDLAALEKTPGKTGSYFQKSTGNEEQAAFIEGHNTLLTENPGLFGGYRFDKDDNLEYVPDMEVPVDAPVSGKQTGITHNKAQIADFYLNKAQGQALLDSYIDTENLDGQLESLIGGDSLVGAGIIRRRRDN